MSKVTLFLFLAEENVDRPLSRKLRDRAAALSFGEGNFSYRESPAGEKPRFDTPSGAFFNVTHTGRLFLCAISKQEVGLDAQLYASCPAHPQKMIARVLCEEEIARVNLLSEEESLREFIRLWTEKEAAAKYSGAGLSAVLKREKPKLVYTDLSGLMESLDIPAAATLATEDVPELELVYLED